MPIKEKAVRPLIHYKRFRNLAIRGSSILSIEDTRTTVILSL